MPQMAPINWLMIIINIILIMLVIISIIYFSFNYEPNNSKKLNKKIKLMFKW
nr:ATP synthase F0 subunit 8 [Aspidomorpha difformis]